MFASLTSFAILSTFVLSSPPSSIQQTTDPQHIVNGDAVETCGWPTAVYTGGCTGTLVHPKAISTAQHCGTPTSIQFGTSAGQGPTVAVVGCVSQGSEDAMLCELAEEVTEVPVTPVLYGCEADAYLQIGQPVVITGFGQTSPNGGSGTKLWANQAITQVEASRVIVGNGGDGTSPCYGDSGGPVFVQVDDGTWRVFGTVLGGTTGTPCNSAANFQRIDTVVPHFESQTGLDITPCFDGQTGAWDPGPECGGFFAGDHSGGGSWDNWCEGIPAGGYSDACGAPFGDDPGGTSGGSAGETDGAGTDGPETTGDSASDSSPGSDSADPPGGTGASAGDDGAETGDASGSSGAAPNPTGSGSASGSFPPGNADTDSGGCGIPSRSGPGGAFALLLVVCCWRRRGC